MDKKEEIELNFHECLSEHGEVMIASAPDDLEGLLIDVFRDQYVPDDSDDLVSTGLQQVHIGGTPESLYDLGRFLIAISKTELPRDFLVHYDRVKGRNGQDAVHLVVHQKIDKDFDQTVSIGELE